MGSTISAAKVESILRKQLKGRLSPTFAVYTGDEKYVLAPVKSILAIVRREKVYKRTYRDDRYDCDNFAMSLHARVMESETPRRKHEFAFGQVWGMEDGLFAHAVNIMVNADGQVRFLEPQVSPDQAIKTVSEYPMNGIWYVHM